MTWRYRGVKDGRPSREIMVATAQTKTIQGVPCTVVSDKLYLSGVLEERTLDYYAQDKGGTVWYFGEDTAELKSDGAVRARRERGLPAVTVPKPGSSCSRPAGGTKLPPGVLQGPGRG